MKSIEKLIKFKKKIQQCYKKKKKYKRNSTPTKMLKEGIKEKT